jgi:hypothetical protein
MKNRPTTRAVMKKIGSNLPIKVTWGHGFMFTPGLKKGQVCEPALLRIESRKISLAETADLSAIAPSGATAEEIQTTQAQAHEGK